MSTSTSQWSEIATFNPIISFHHGQKHESTQRIFYTRIRRRIFPMSSLPFTVLWAIAHKEGKRRSFINKISGGKTQPRLAIFHKACASCSVLLYILYIYILVTKHMFSLILLCSRLSSDLTTSLFDLPTTPFPCAVMIAKNCFNMVHDDCIQC